MEKLIESVIRSFGYALAIGAFLVLASCTPKKSETSSFSIVLPDFNLTLKKNSPSQMSAKADLGANNYTVRKITRVMINVSGPGIVPEQVFIWEGHDSGSAPPSSYPFTVPIGSNALIQVLVITQDMEYSDDGNVVDEGKETFFYGDMEKVMANASESADLAVSSINVTTTGAEGVIEGRYLDGVNTGPTGRVNIKFAPQSGRPPMIVSQSEMHGGWFSLFALEGIPFTYELVGRGSLFSGFSLVSPNFTFDQQKMLISGPASYYNIYLPNSSTVVGRRAKSPRKSIIGFFADPQAAGVLAGKKICYMDADYTPGSNSGGRVYLSSDINDQTVVSWTGASPAANEFGVAAGGSVGASASGECVSAGTKFVDWLSPTTDRVFDGHGILPFNGAFAAFVPAGSSYPTSLNAQFNAATQKVDLRWQYLPGVTGSGRITGVEVFARVKTNQSNYDHRRPDYERDDGIACNEFISNPERFTPQFVSRGRFNVSADASGIQTASIDGFLATDFSSQNSRPEIVLCPFTDSKTQFFTGGTAYRSNGGGGSTSGGSSAQLSISLANSNIRPATCVPVTLTYLGANNVPTNVSSNVSVNLSLSQNTSGTGLFYPTSQCSTGGASSLTATIPANSSSTVVYFQDNNPGDLNLQASAANLMQGWAQLTVVSNATPTSSQLNLRAKNYTGNVAHLITGQCYELEARLSVFSSGQNVPSNDAARSFTLPGVPGGAYFTSQSDCQSNVNSTTSLAFTAIEARKSVYLRAGTSGSSIAISGPTSNTVSFDVAPSAVASLRLVIDGASFTPGPGVDSSIPDVYYDGNLSCIPVRVEARGANHGSVYPATSIATTVSSNQFLFFDDSTCGSAGLASKAVTISQNGGSVFYTKAISGGVMTGTVTVSSTAPAISTVTTFIRRPDSLFLSGLPLNMGSGNPKLMQGYCQKLTLHAQWGGAEVASAMPMTYYLNTQLAGGVTFYNNSSCAGQYQISQLVVPASVATPVDFWMRSTDSPSTAMSLSVGLMNVNSMLMQNLEVVAPPYLTMMRSPMGTMTPNSCVAIMPAWQSSAVAPADVDVVISVSGDTFNLAMNANSNYFYTDGSCSVPATSATVSAILPANTDQLTPPPAYVKFIGTTFSSALFSVDIVSSLPGNQTSSGPSSCTSTCSW